MSCIKCPSWSKGRISEIESFSASNTPIRSPSVEEEVGMSALNQWRVSEVENRVSIEDIIELANGDAAQDGITAQNGHYGRSSTNDGPRMFASRRKRVSQNMSEKAKDVAVPFLLHSFMIFMYYSGLSQYKRFKPDPADETCFEKTLGLIQKICYFLNLIPSVLRSLQLTKFGVLYFLDEKGVNEFVDLCYYFFILITKLYSAYLFMFGDKKITATLTEMEKYASDKHVTVKQIKRKVRSSWWIHLLGISSIATNLLRVIFKKGFTDWSIEAVLQKQADGVETFLFAWKPSQFYFDSGDNSTLEGSTVTATNVTELHVMTKSTVAMGVAGIIMDFCSGIQIDAIRDLITVLSATLSKYIKKFLAKIKDEAVLHLEDCFGLKNYAKFEEDWGSFRMLKRVVKETNDTFDVLLKLMHINHLLLFPYFMTLCIGIEEVSGVRLFILMINLIKTLFTLFIARQMAESNDICRKWIWIWACETGSICVQNQVWNINVLLDELEREPLGLGKGNFLIDESFVFRFFGLVGSLFMILAEDKEKSAKLRLR